MTLILKIKKQAPPPKKKTYNFITGLQTVWLGGGSTQRTVDFKSSSSADKT